MNGRILITACVGGTLLIIGRVEATGCPDVLDYDRLEQIDISGEAQACVGCLIQNCTNLCMLTECVAAPVTGSSSLARCGGALEVGPINAFDSDSESWMGGATASASDRTTVDSVRGFAGTRFMGASFNVRIDAHAQSADFDCVTTPDNPGATAKGRGDELMVSIPFEVLEPGGTYTLWAELAISEGCDSLTTIGSWDIRGVDGSLQVTNLNPSKSESDSGQLSAGEYTFTATLNTEGQADACAFCPGSDEEDCDFTTHFKVNFGVVECYGDIDGDGVIGINDFLQLLGQWGPCPMPPDGSSCPSDLNLDCEVDNLDFLILLGLTWGPCP